jgi:hypothetical protein
MIHVVRRISFSFGSTDNPHHTGMVQAHTSDAEVARLSRPPGAIRMWRT